MEFGKVKAAVIAVPCLFLLSALFCFFLIGPICLIIAGICFSGKGFDLVDVLWLGIFTVWLLYLAVVSIVYTIRFAVAGKNKIGEYLSASSSQQQQQQRRRNKVDEVMVGLTELLWLVTSVSLGVVINVGVRSLQQRRRERGNQMVQNRMLLMLIASLIIFLLFMVVIPVSYIYSTRHWYAGNKSTTASPSPKQHVILQESDANPTMS